MAMNNDKRTTRRIAHLHGTFNPADSIILSIEDYKRAYGLDPTAEDDEEKNTSRLRFRLLWAVLATRRVVFVGFSMDDPYLNKILETVSEDLWTWNKSTHFAIMSISSKDAEDSKDKSERLNNEYGVGTVFYENPDNSHRGLEDIVNEIYVECSIGRQSTLGPEDSSDDKGHSEGEELELAASRSRDALDWLKRTSQRMIGRIGDEIKREKLLNDLQDFAMQGNGVIIGSPGVGKTYLLKELYRSLESLEIPELILPIDQLGDGTNETLRKELSYEGDLIEKLKSVPGSGKNAILLFDAFDAARDEKTRRRFLSLIRRAILELRESWNIVVTVRTYDAKKSQELLDLFDSPDDAQQSTDIRCRHFTIPPFNEDEILQAFEQIGCPKTIYDNGSQDFKNILALPFNLWLLEKILKSSDRIPDFSQIHSEVQLIGLFWQRRIENENSEHLLRQIADKMVQERLLSVKMNDIYDDVNLDKPARRNAWDKLQSDEILARVVFYWTADCFFSQYPF